MNSRKEKGRRGGGGRPAPRTPTRSRCHTCAGTRVRPAAEQL